MFVGRQRELDALDRLYAKPSFQMLVLYGRRRVGKTTLLEHFAKGKPSVFFTAKEQSSARNLQEFSQALFEYFDTAEGLAAFDSWGAAFSFLAKRVKGQSEKLVFVFDEFPYAAATDPSLPSVLQVAIDRELKSANVLLVLSGSNEGFMESNVLGGKSPLYGRRTAQIKLEPFDYYDAAKMLPAVTDPRELVRYYAAFGGTPYCLAQINDGESYLDNINGLLFETSGLLYEEPLMILRQELREPSLYNSILYAVASGATSPKEIAERAGVESGTTSRYLKTLEDLGLISRTVPFGENPARSKRSIYRLKDPFFAYWYRFVGPNIGAIEAGAGRAVAEKRAAGEALAAYEGYAFERVCRQWLQRANQNDVLPFLATEFGSWWGMNPAKREQTDIDVIAADRQEKKILLGECKWRESVNETEALEGLRERVGLIKGYENCSLYLFTKNPVEKGTARKGEDGSCCFVDAEGLFDF